MLWSRSRIPGKWVLENYGTWEKPSDRAAELSTLSFRRHHEARPVCGSRIEDFHEFGEGHTLYFFFLKFVQRIFFIMFIFYGLPTIAINVLSNFYGEVGIDSLTLGSLGPFQNIDLTNFTSTQTNVEDERAFVSSFREANNASVVYLIESILLKKQDALLCLSILDGFAAVVFFVAVLMLERYQHRIAVDVDTRTVTVADYSVCIQGLPRNTTHSELFAFFSEWGEVHSIELVRTDCELIERARIEKRCSENVKVAVARAARYAAKRSDGNITTWLWLKLKIQETLKERADAYTQSLLQERSHARVVCAFVTMREASKRIELLYAYPISFGRRLFTPRHQRFRGKYRIKALPAPEPADIIWENLQFGSINRLKRRTATTALKYLALLISFFFVNLATLLRHTNPATINQERCDAECGYYNGGSLSLSDEQRSFYKDCYEDPNTCTDLESACYACYCENVLMRGMDTSESLYCSAFLTDFATATASEVVVVLSIVLINLSMMALATQLSKWERHHTRIQQEASTSLALFLFQFINTALSTVVATTHLPRIRGWVADNSILKRLFVGVYVDTTPNWYQEVGRGLTVTVIVQSISRLACVFMRWLIFKLKFCCRTKSLTERQLRDAYIGPEFLLAPRYGELLNLIFVTMFFGSGIPLLYFVTAISFSFQFMTEKAELLKLSQWPTSYGSDLAKMVARLLPYATLWHCAFSTWTFSLQKTEKNPFLPATTDHFLEKVGLVLGYLFNDNEKHQQAKAFAERLMQTTSAHHFLLFLIFAIFLFIKVTMTIWVHALTKVASFLGIIRGAQFLSPSNEDLPDIQSAIDSELLIGPTSYSLRSNPKYNNMSPILFNSDDDNEPSSSTGTHDHRFA